MFNASQQQKDILAKVLEGKNVAVEAGPGCGKSTTLKYLVENILNLEPNAKILSVVFSNSAKKESVKKLGGFGQSVDIFTSHQIGNALLRNQPIKWKFNAALKKDCEHKYKFIVHNLVKENVTKDKKNPLYWKSFHTTVDLVNKARMTLTNYEDSHALYDLANFYGIDVDGSEFSMVSQAIAEGISQFEKNKWSDFADMVFLPASLELPATFGMSIGSGKDTRIFTRFYDYILVDEAQDLNNAQIQLFKAYADTHTKFVIVGDVMQSINLFSGSNPRSFQHLIETYNCERLPLTESFRLPTSHIDNLNQMFGTNLTATSGAIEGETFAISHGQIIKHVKPGDLIIGRFRNGQKAQLYPTLFALLKENIPTTLLGLNHISLCDTGLDYLEEYGSFKEICQDFDRIVSEFCQNNSENKRLDDILFDLEVLENFLAWAKPKNRDDFFEKLTPLLWDKANAVIISTVDTAKGLEAHQVFGLDSNNFPYSFKNETDDMKQQEINRQYVLLSRTQDKYFHVN